MHVSIQGIGPSSHGGLVLGNYSVHASAEALRRGEDEIRRIGKRLRADGIRSYALRQY